MIHPRLRAVAARYALDLTTTGELVDAADAALNDGIYSYSLGELGTFRNPTWADVSPLFQAALRELEIPMPSRKEALDTIIGVHAAAITEGAVEPLAGLEELYSVYRAPRNPRTPDSGGLEELRRFVDYYYAYEIHHATVGYQATSADVTAAEQALAALDRECIHLAAEWCRARWGPCFDPSWRTAAVVALARQMYESRNFGGMPILADALEDAGCDSEDVLSHCRGSGPHARGCWIVDLILGKS